MAEEVGIDQETFDKAIAEGKPERVARALAKSAFVRKTKGPAGPGTPLAAAAAPAAPAAEGAPAPAAAAGTPVPAAAPAAATATLPRLTPEERAARVAAATGTKVNGGGGRGTGVGDTHRLLAFVPPDSLQRVEKRQEDKINVWPHLLAEEFFSLVVVLAGLLIFSAFVNAPSRDLANPFLTPNPSKAPWYFLGLQELLRYFHPMIAGVTLPGLGLFGLMAVPYLDRNPSMRPDKRKLAIMLFTVFVMMWSVLVIIGVFFRGKGFNWIWPWQTGLFVDL
jgi:menaquinol-cytochrome c reductase cytochrome b/c subunit